MRCAVEEAICDEIRGPHADSFQVAVNIALAFLRKHYLIPFLSSQHYVHLLSDMIRQCASVMDHTLSSSSSSSCSVAVMPGEHSMVESSSGSDCEHLRVSSNGKQSLKCPRVDPESIWHRRKQRQVLLVACYTKLTLTLTTKTLPKLPVPSINVELKLLIRFLSMPLQWSEFWSCRSAWEILPRHWTRSWTKRQ